jgi:ATP-dependent exoDNAse (exonuclease V) beta subunit
MAREQSGQSLSGFLRGLQDLSAREAREGEALGAAPESGAVMLLSIHAAKGLEFPVVVVADLGRRPNRPGEAQMILHDPAIGLVCKQRDENGDWQTPGGYAWGQWLLSRMEAAENKRLLYVACTRAADLLILSGKPGERSAWMSELLAAWQVDPAGQEAEIANQDGYSIRILRPAYNPGEAASMDQPTISSPGLTEMPELARSIPALPAKRHLAERHLAVTHLRRVLAEETGESMALRPPVRPAHPGSGSPRPPASLTGRVVHRLLANWENLTLPVHELESRLIASARREGILRPEAIAYAASRALGMLENLKICSAPSWFTKSDPPPSVTAQCPSRCPQRWASCMGSSTFSSRIGKASGTWWIGRQTGSQRTSLRNRRQRTAARSPSTPPRLNERCKRSQAPGCASWP